MFDRVVSLIGEEKFKCIQNINVLIIGIGGVGGYALEALVRSGVRNITIVDYDNIDVSNLNRQIIAHSNNLGQSKVLEGEKRAKLINPDINITCINECVNEDNIDNFLSKNYHYVIDACDTSIVKFLLMRKRDEYGYKLISCMGTAKKVNPEKLAITTLDKTSYDPLAKKLRYMLRKDKVKGKFMVVSSCEEVSVSGKTLGSLVTVPAVAGFFLATYVINDIINN